MIKEIKTSAKVKRAPKERLHSNRIRAILKEKGFTQGSLAKKLDYDEAHLSRIINGQLTCIQYTTAIDIARALNTPVEKVFIYKKKRF